MLMCINPVDNTKRNRLSLYLEAMEPPPVHYTPSTHYTQPPASVILSKICNIYKDCRKCSKKRI